MATGLPLEYQQELEQIARRRKMAEAMRGLQFNQPQMVSGHYVKASPLAHLAQAFAQYQGHKRDTDLDAEQSKVYSRAMEDQARQLQSVQSRLSPQRRELQGPPAEGEVMGVQVTPPDAFGAEQEAQRSQFPAVQALGKALMENRLKSQDKLRETLAGRVSLEAVPRVFEGETKGLPPKQEFGVTDGVPYQKSEGGISRVGPGYAQGTMPGADGRTMQVQTAPLTGRVDAIDKSPKVSVSTGGPEDPYWKKVATDLGEKDAARVAAGRDAPLALEEVSRIRKASIDARGQWTGGPAAGPVRLIRDLASQVGVPLDPNIDLNNARLQAEFSGMIAQQIIGQGRGLTDEDRRALQASFPSDRMTPAMLPAFLEQYERRLRANANVSGRVLGELQRQGKARMPTALRDNPPLPSGRPTGEMTVEEMRAELETLRRAGR